MARSRRRGLRAVRVGGGLGRRRLRLGPSRVKRHSHAQRSSLSVGFTGPYLRFRYHVERERAVFGVQPVRSINVSLRHSWLDDKIVCYKGASTHEVKHDEPNKQGGPSFFQQMGYVLLLCARLNCKDCFEKNLCLVVGVQPGVGDSVFLNCNCSCKEVY